MAQVLRAKKIFSAIRGSDLLDVLLPGRARRWTILLPEIGREMCLGLGLGQRVVVFDSFSMLNE
jgi:hypothetical protein